MDDRYLLLVTRNFPPQVGGLERYSYDLYHALKDEIKTDLLKHSRGIWYYPVFFLYSLIYIAINRKKYTHIHFCDAALSPLAAIARLFSPGKISISVHALDIIFENRFYQWIVPSCLARADNIVAVSHYTLQQCLRRGIDAARCHVIPNGINLSQFDASVASLKQVTDKYRLDIRNRKILFTIGRLIRRKGIAWFVESVMPQLGDEYIYLIAGDGPERQAILDVINRYGLGQKVSLLGRISDSEKYCLYQHADLFIMPNILVPGDAEGFGITIIEAAAFGLPAIATNLEGIPDTMMDGVTGSLVEPGNPGQYIEILKTASFDRQQIIRLTRDKYDWFVLKNEYLQRLFS